MQIKTTMLLCTTIRKAEVNRLITLKAGEEVQQQEPCSAAVCQALLYAPMPTWRDTRRKQVLTLPRLTPQCLQNQHAVWGLFWNWVLGPVSGGRRWKTDTLAPEAGAGHRRLHTARPFGTCAVRGAEACQGGVGQAHASSPEEPCTSSMRWVHPCSTGTYNWAFVLFFGCTMRLTGS